MGNVRLSYFKNGSNSAEVLEENNYYPFGMKHEGYNALAGNPAYAYGYNNKELQKETGWSDYGARMYMPEIGRWGVIDPLAEMYTRHSPYHYAVNNPMRFIDPDGRSSQTFEGQDAVNAYWHLVFGGSISSLSGGSSFGSLGGQEFNLSSFFHYIDPGGSSGSGGSSLSPWMQANLDPGPKYTPQHYALIQGLSTFANKLFGSPFTLDKLTEKEKQAIFKKSASKTTAILMYEYASGTGPANRIFFPGDALTEDIKWSNSSARATTMFANDYNAGLINDGDIVRYYIGTSPDKIGLNGSLSAHIKGLADQSIWRGGMVYTMQKRGDKLYVNIFDKYTVSSGISRNDADTFDRGKTITPLGTTTITIHFNYQWINTK
ncbi:RHS repeat-associated core domain [Chryseobacterium taihuense]|uniref:RHS repeat-associated core domain n=1 Tax=Chryseobacterium taihuense TaxID=1141221 RepID=A0A4U8WMZ7_9FLAO|nr:RHS repeat-associated core domain [Chryseobacterium taihuense]